MLDNRRSAAELPRFNGVFAVLDLIEDLYHRRRHPTHGIRPREVPMLCLIRPDEHDHLLPAISECLNQGTPSRIPHALVTRQPPSENPSGTEIDSPPTPEDVRTLLELLVESAGKLTNSRNASARAGRLRFPRLSLAAWLMQQELSVHDTRRHHDLRARLRNRGINRRIGDLFHTVNTDAPALPAWLRWSTALLGFLPPVWFRIKSSGRVPFLGSEYRWFLRQPYLAPDVPGTFLGFAERLTTPEWQQEAPDQLLKFLTNSFLEDLRQEYPRFRLRGVRRTSRAILLLDHITLANGGYRLLELINDVRNDIGRPDPLLVIAASRKIPPYARQPWSESSEPENSEYSAYDATNAAEGYADWRRQLMNARRKRNEIAWYLPIRTDTGAPEPPGHRPRNSGGTLGFTLDRSPWWSRRLTTAAATAVVIASCVTGYDGWSTQHCGDGVRWPGLSPTLHYLREECVGITDGSYNILQPSNEGLETIQHEILRQNRLAEREHHENPERPYVTLAYVGALTSPEQHNNAPGQQDVLVAKRKELAGVAVAQEAARDAKGDTPLVRVLLVNAGRKMWYGQQVATELGSLATRDSSLIGVIGLDHSSTATKNTIQALGTAGLPMVAGALTADPMAQAHPMYFQVAPPNHRQAEVAAGLISRLHADHGAPGLGIAAFGASVRIYYSADETDLYSKNLRDVINTQMVDKGFEVHSTSFDPVFHDPSQRGDGDLENPNSAGRHACAEQGLVYYAGRGIPDFEQFISGVARKCPNNPPLILGGHDTSRYVASDASRQNNRSVPFLYQSSAVGPGSGSLRDNPKQLAAERDFYSKLKRYEHDDRSSLDGHAALAHDAALSMIEAARHVVEHNIPITPAAVWRELSNLHRDRNFTGATGVIDFGGDLTRDVPLNKPVMILQVRDGKVHDTLIGFCGGNADRRREVNHPCPATQGGTR